MGLDSNTRRQNRCFPAQTTSIHTEDPLAKNYQQPKPSQDNQNKQTIEHKNQKETPPRAFNKIARGNSRS